MKKPNLQPIQKVFLLSCISLFIASGASGQSAGRDKKSVSSDQIILSAPTMEVDATGFKSCEPASKIDDPSWIISGPKLFKDDPYLKQVISSKDRKNKIDKSGEKWNGYFTLAYTEETVIPDNDHFSFSWLAPDEVPSNAVITNVQYKYLIDDNDNATTFYPKDYEVYINSHASYTCVYDNLGITGSHNDEGHDDDADNDTDIDVDYRSSHFFDGQEADQPAYGFRIEDTDLGFTGKLIYFYLRVSWEADDPNLTCTNTPPGWDDPIVVNYTSGSHTNAAVLYANTTTYLNFSLSNENYDIPAGSDFGFDFWYSIDDGDQVGLYAYDDGIDVDDFITEENIEKVFTEGEHELCQIVDLLDNIPETDDTDNEYCVTLTWVGPPIAPELSSPSDEATGQSTSPTLNWAASTHATEYTLQIDDNDDLSSPITYHSISETSFDVTDLSANGTYYWRVKAENPAGESDYSEIWQFTTGATGIEDLKDAGYSLEQNYPNPFTETTSIEFNLPVANTVNIEILDLQGKLIESFSGDYSAGKHTLEIDLRGKAQSGVYLYRMTTDDFTDTKLFTFR